MPISKSVSADRSIAGSGGAADEAFLRFAGGDAKEADDEAAAVLLSALLCSCSDEAVSEGRFFAGVCCSASDAES